MKKNVIFWCGVKSQDPYLQKKHGGFKYLDISRKSWEYWCKTNNCIFVPYENPSMADTNKYRANWQRWFDVFDELDRKNIHFDQIASVDGSSIIKWNAPNFFNLTQREFTCWRSLENLRWVYESATGYKQFFNDFQFDLTQYFNSGFVVFNEKHKFLFQALKTLYYENFNDLMRLQHKVVKRGTDQPILNYLVQMHNIKTNMTLPTAFFLVHLQRFDWFSHNWQLQKDSTPFFIKYGYIWFFSGFSQRGERYKLMTQTWDIIKDNYQ